MWKMTVKYIKCKNLMKIWSKCKWTKQGQKSWGWDKKWQAAASMLKFCDNTQDSKLLIIHKTQSKRISRRQRECAELSGQKKLTECSSAFSQFSLLRHSQITLVSTPPKVPKFQLFLSITRFLAPFIHFWLSSDWHEILSNEKSGSVIGFKTTIWVENEGVCVWGGGGHYSLQTGVQLPSYLLSNVRPWANSNSRTNPQTLEEI